TSAGSARRRRLRGAAAVELHSDGATVNERLGRQQVGFMDRFRLKSIATSKCPRSTQDRIKHALQAQRKRSNNGNCLLNNHFSPTEHKEPFKFL
ncbi:hypothetical protein, partial [Azotobacter chroococcum]|uniref:hypothetical protein n=1 Tax=Azotobacter chroococcum TaxID=353 RepID=UPI001A953E50